MINKELIEKINNLYHKSKTVGLTEAEKEQQASLRQEYLSGIRAQVKSTLNRVKFVEEEHTEDCECGHKH